MSDAIIGRDIAAETKLAKSRPLVSRRALATAGIILAIGGAAWFGTDWWNRGRFIQSTDDAYVGGNVTVLAPHVPGFVSQIRVADNQYVKAGDLLVAAGDTAAAAERGQG